MNMKPVKVTVDVPNQGITELDMNPHSFKFEIDQSHLDVSSCHSAFKEYIPHKTHLTLSGEIMHNYHPKGRTLNRKALIV